MARFGILTLLCASICSLGSGCYSPSPIPKTYFEKKCEISVSVGKCPAKAQMADSGQGGLIGAMVTADRATKMKAAMAGIAGDTVKELIRQRFGAEMEKHLDLNEDGQLQAVINISQWGWYAPTTVVGIRTGAYQFIIGGQVTVTDKGAKKKTQVGTVVVSATESIGNAPTAALSQEALLKCANKFAADAVSFLVKESQPPAPKSKS